MTVAQVSSVPEWPSESDISGNKRLSLENSSPTSDSLSDVKFGTNLDVLAESTVRKYRFVEISENTGTH